MIVAQECGTRVLHKILWSPRQASPSDIRAVTQCAQAIKYGSWGVYQLSRNNGCEFCRECFPESVS
jgi:hypothetical protein